MGFTHKKKPPLGSKLIPIKSSGLGKMLNISVHDPTVLKDKKDIKPYDADEELNQKFIEAGIIEPEKKIGGNSALFDLVNLVEESLKDNVKGKA